MMIWAFIGYLIFLVVLATLLSRKIAGLSDFFMAGRKLPMWCIALTYVAAWFGAGSTMGTMNAAFTQGIGAAWLIAIPSVLSCLVVVFFLAQKVRQLGTLSQPEAVEAHYGSQGSLLLALIIFCSITTFIASQLVAAASLLQLTFGLSPVWGIVAILAAVVTYSSIGGFRAVVMTDILQFVCFTLGLMILLVFALGSHVVPIHATLPPVGLGDLARQLPQNLAMVFTFVLAWSIAPEMWQRMTSSKDPQSAKRSALLATGILALLYVMVISIGVLGTRYLPLQTLQNGGNVVVQLAQLLPSPILTAMVLVGVLSAITSTIDSSLNVGTLTFARNIVQRFVWPQASEKQIVLLSRLAMPLIGLPATVIALKYQSIVQVLWISADIYASTMFIPIMGLFYWSNAPQRSGVWAMALGAIPVVLNFAHDFTHLPLPDGWPGWPYTTLLGVALSGFGFWLGVWVESWGTAPTAQPNIVPE